MMAAPRDCLKGVAATPESFLVLAGLGSDFESLKPAATPGPQWERGFTEPGQSDFSFSIFFLLMVQWIESRPCVCYTITTELHPQPSVLKVDWVLLYPLNWL